MWCDKRVGFEGGNGEIKGKRRRQRLSEGISLEKQALLY
jgi:hypothetical protein